MTHRTVVRAVTAAALLWSAIAFAPSAMAQVNINIGIGVAPPAPVYEVVPGPRPGYIWQPGYWDWDDHYHKHNWKKGKWAKARPGYVYESPRWVQASNGWVMQPGRWNQGPDWDRRGHDHDHDYDHDHDHGHRGKGGYHCPPGHAKKGEC
ncbi:MULTISPECIES: YXWGXW repeat-containing protein [unclassified Cupriavidus]|uniref:YXWGXW repeat-containing protein n=1 Tax=unclassified Cupriavidus TaxID=2640874 RepID=UPI00088271AD|nr:YXWGXW repeat-containing protein [Cupriavidus sp. YR651]SDC11224.1 YXWGXW repeat-containing protein [Cupriavidus sp. YR651]